MSSLAKAFAAKDITQHGKAQLSHATINPGKVLPATATGNLFAVTGSVLVTGLYGIVATVLSATNVKPTLGVTGSPAAIAAAPAAAFTATAVGAVVVMPPAFGGPLPAALTAQAGVSAAGLFVVNAANITITTDATNTGAITWVLEWSPLFPKIGATVTAV